MNAEDEFLDDWWEPVSIQHVRAKRIAAQARRGSLLPALWLLPLVLGLAWWRALRR